MFNGIIKNTGKIYSLSKNDSNFIIGVQTKMKFKNNEIGSSISCSGVCLTVDKIKKNIVFFYLSKETLNKSTFVNIKKKDTINLEKSLKYGERISGHFVQGHVDTKCRVEKIIFQGRTWLIDFDLQQKFRKYIVQKGSISINGVSLTIAKILKNGFRISVIPKTLKLTNFLYLKKNNFVNVEFDIFGKYIKNFIKK